MNGITIIYSNPFFEFYLLKHYCKTSDLCTINKYNEEQIEDLLLKRSLMKKKDIDSDYCEKTMNKAIESSRKNIDDLDKEFHIMTEHNMERIINCNSNISNMHTLIESIKGIRN